jgi:anti-sigma B factor antagonist
MAGKQFDAHVRNLAEKAIIDLSGEIDAAAEAQLQQAYDTAIDSSPAEVVLNFSDVIYMNSTGIALIVSLLAQARKSHRTLSVFGLSDHYREIFHLTRLSDFMHIYNDEASLLAV